jgi:hypothetical protein
VLLADPNVGNDFITVCIGLASIKDLGPEALGWLARASVSTR